MLDEHDETSSAPSASETSTFAATSEGDGAAAKRPAKKAAKKAAAKKAAAKKTTKKAAAQKAESAEVTESAPSDEHADASMKTAKAPKTDKATKKATAKKAPAKKANAKKTAPAAEEPMAAEPDTAEPSSGGAGALAMPLFKAPDPAVAAPSTKAETKASKASKGSKTAKTPKGSKASKDAQADTDGTTGDSGQESQDLATSEDQGDEAGATRRRRSRGGRNRRKSGADADQGSGEGETKTTKGGGSPDDSSPKDGSEAADSDESGSSHRRRRRRRGGDDSGSQGDAGSTTKVRKPRAKKESITSVEGSTRIEAKKQRRREGREAGRRRPPILSESEFLARRESVERVMAIRQRGETTQIAVLEDDVLVEHYVALASQNSIIGNVYLGRVQNVLPSMEAAFIDIGKGRNAVLYAGEVNWDLRDDKNQPRRIENALKPGQAVLVQASKDPVGHKGARLTSQISLPGRYLVYVPGGGTSGISRKLPDTERNRLKNLLKDILPEDAGVIIRTAAEGASEDELTRDVTRLTARWEDIEKKSKNGQAPQLLYSEPDTTLKVVRDLFTEDFSKLVISGDDAWDMVDGYVQHVAPDLTERLERHEGDKDVFERFRIEEQIAKALERKVWLPSGGSLVIDRTEAMTVVDVNTGKFTGSGGNLEETVTKNNLEAAEEIVRQLRLRDIGGIIVVDFIDMVLENNRDLVLRRLVECLGRDRTRHQVAEVTSLGLVQMTRKRISTGLLEAFSHTCEHCQGRGVVIEGVPVEPKKQDDHQQSTNGARGGAKRSSNRRRGGRRGGEDQDAEQSTSNEAGSDSSSAADSGSDQSAADQQPTNGSSSSSSVAGDSRATSAERENGRPAAQPTGQAADQQADQPAGQVSGAVSGLNRSPRLGTDPADELPSATTPRGRRRRRASRPTGAPSSTS